MEKIKPDERMTQLQNIRVLIQWPRPRLLSLAAATSRWDIAGLRSRVVNGGAGEELVRFFGPTSCLSGPDRWHWWAVAANALGAVSDYHIRSMWLLICSFNFFMFLFFFFSTNWSECSENNDPLNQVGLGSTETGAHYLPLAGANVLCWQ